MMKNSILRVLVVTGICCGLFAWGCEQKAQTGGVEAKPMAPVTASAKGEVKIALKPTVGEKVTYKIVTQARRTTKWQGPVPNQEAFEENYTDERVELVVTRRVQDVDPNGVATAQVTIDGLKSLNTNKNSASVDFDSSRSSDANNPLMQLIGRTYRIEYNTGNSISAVDELPPVNVLLKGETPSDRAGLSMMYPDSITERHSAFALPQPGKQMVKSGDKWSKIKTFSFGKMGLKSYEKIYVLKEVKDVGARMVAVIDMNAIPTSEVEPRFASQKGEVGAPKMFDSNDSYTGGGEFDLNAGRIENYHENFRANWVVALPSKQGDNSEPVVLNMSSTYVYSIERVK